jgi:uncharacterized protein
LDVREIRSYIMKTKFLIIGLMCMLCLTLVSAADYPRLTPYINDLGNILTDSQEVALNDLLGKIEENTTVEIVVLTVDNTDGEDRVLYAAHVGEENGIGKEKADNGIVVMWSKDNEQGLAIATGRGIESEINDAKAGRILRDNRPLFDAGNYSEGFELIIGNLSQEIGYQNAVPTSDDGDNTWLIIIVVVILLIIIIAAAASSSSSGGSSSGGGSLGGSSSGGGGFGGGGFGGGGAHG